MVQRRRKVEPSAMLWPLVLGFATGRERTLAGLRRVYQCATGTSLVASAFYDRFTPELERFLRAVLHALCGHLAAHEPASRGVLSKFADVVVTDASVVKLHLVMSAMGKGLEKVKLTGERANDHRSLRMGPWVAGRLLLFDLGYFRYQLFDCIDRNGGYFLTRLPAGANPLIVGVNRLWRGRTVALEGKRLDEVAGKLRRMTLDVEVEVEVQRRIYAGRRRTQRRCFRLIGVRDADSHSYWFYLTNIPAEESEAEPLAQVYACRWQVELLFKELKSHYRLADLPTRKSRIVEALILSSLITLLVSRRLLDAVRERLRRLRHRIPEGRWAALFSAAALNLLSLVTLPARAARTLARRIEPVLLHEAVDPNKSRLLLLQRVDQGVAWAA